MFRSLLSVACMLFVCVSVRPLLVLGQGDSSSASSSSIDSSTGTGTGIDSSSGTGTGTGTGSASSINSNSSSISFSSSYTNNTNTSKPVIPSVSPVIVRDPNSTRAVCYARPDYDAWLSINDKPPWDCPRPDVDGGILGPRNRHDPCLNLTAYLYSPSNLEHYWIDKKINQTIDYRPPDLCPAGTLASRLNTTAKYPYSYTVRNSPTVSGTYQVPTQVTKGDPYPIMLVTSNVLFNYKMLFMPKVDEFTQLEIGASHGVKYFSVPNTYISVEAGNRATEPRLRTFRTPLVGTDSLGLGEKTSDIIFNYQDTFDDHGNHFPNPDAGSSFRYAVVPFWTVLINADNGVINDIHFDEGCDTCSDQLCSPDNNCGVKEYACYISNATINNPEHAPVFSISSLSKCALDRVSYFEHTMADRATMTDPGAACLKLTQPLNSSWSLLNLQTIDTQTDYTKNSTDCAIKVYVGWTGTDKNGKYFTSAGKRLSVFRRYSIGAAYNSAALFAGNALPTAPDTTGTNIPGQG